MGFKANDHRMSFSLRVRSSMTLVAWNLLLAAVLELGNFGTFFAFAQETSPGLHGSWTATAGSRTLRGSWGAQTSRQNADAAQGYWTLLNESDERVLQGTWTARKTGSRWQGTWTARTSQGQSFSGAWDADVTDRKTRTLVDMLIETLAKEVAGSWQSGRFAGNWWLQSSRNSKGPR